MLAGPLIALCLVATIAMPTASAASTRPAAPATTRTYPVPYTFLAGILAAPNGPDTPPPGANDWSCKPSAAHPEPVILVHGLLATQTDNWQTISPLLADNGYCVFSLTYGQIDPGNPLLHYLGGLAPMQRSAKELGAFVDRVLAATGASKVDLVGHSEGATMPYWYLKFDGGAAKVAKMVGISPVVHGTHLADVATLAAALFPGVDPSAFLASVCASCAQFAPASPFTRRLDQGGVAVPGVAYTQIMTRYDELVVPYTSGVVRAPNSTNIVVQRQCPFDVSDHLAIVADETAADDVLNALDPAHRRPVRCTLTLPIIG